MPFCMGKGGSVPNLFAGAGVGGNSLFAQALAGLQSFRRARVALNYVAEFHYSVFLFAKFDQRETFLQLSRSYFASRGKVLQDLIVTLLRLLIVSLAELNFAQIEVAISGEIGVGIELDVVGKF